MRPAFLLILLSVMSFSCIGYRRHSEPKPRVYEPEVESSETTQVGIASWYGIEEHKNRAASGEVFDKDELTAAHKTLPMDTIVRVTNLENGKDVIVRVNDRGPFVGNRIIDLSYAAAKEVDMIGPGTVQVKVEVISTPHRKGDYFSGKYVVQVGSFKSKSNAENLKEKLSSDFSNVDVYEYTINNNTYYRVRLAGYNTKSDAEHEYKKLKKLGYKPTIKLE